MTPEAFGKALVESGDLDPIYLMLNAGTQNPDTTARWCLGYWMFYHAGVASTLAEQRGEAFWETVWRAQTEKWPRGTERRHFKAENSRKSIEDLQRRFPVPEDAVGSLAGYGTWESLVDSAPPEGRMFADVASSVRQWVGFGPWIAFKVADMLDAVIGVPVTFPNDASVWFDDPVKGGIWAHALHLDARADKESISAYYEALTSKEKVQTATRTLHRLLETFKDLRGPDGRGVRVQEVETVLCKWKSHMNGHYPIGKDTREVLHGLTGWGSLAHQLQQALRDATPEEHHA